MLSQEQLQAIVRATGRLPPGYENVWRPLQWTPMMPPPAAVQQSGKKRGRPRKEPQPQQQAAPAQAAQLPHPPPPVPKPPQRKWPLFAEQGSVEREVTAHLHERLAIFVDHMEYHHEAQIIGGRMILKPIPEAGWFDGFRQTQTFLTYPDWYCRLSSNNYGAEYDTSCGIESGEPLAWE